MTRDARRCRPGIPDPPAELCVVGDADQSIYAFRGATIRNILEFEQDYPDAHTILLEQNYRSTQTILRAANAVIARNPDRRPKNLWTDSGEGDADRRLRRRQRARRGGVRRRRIDGLSDDDGVKPGDVAVFYRTNAQSRAFEEVFVRVGLPYKVVGGTRFYERKEIKDALAYLRVLANPDDTVNLRRILNVPRRGIGDRAEACVAALGRARADPVRRRPGPGGGRAGHRDPQRRRDRGVHRPARGAARRRRGRGRGRRAARGGPRADRLPRRAAPQPRPAGRDPGREPRRAASPSPGSTRRAGRDRRAGEPRRLPRAGLARRRRRRDARRGRRPTQGVRHADDAAHRQGAGVPGRLPHRHGGRRLPAHALARRPEGARGGAPARLRRHHPGPQRLYLSRAAVRSAWGAPQYNPPRGSSTRSPTTLIDWERERGRERRGARRARASLRPSRRLAARPGVRSPGQPPGHRARGRATGSPTTRSASAPWCGSRATASGRWPTSTSAPRRASSGCCCATPRVEKL